MRYIFLLILFIPLLSADAKYVIQVLSVKDESAVTDAFIAKLDTLPVPYVKEYIDGEHKVFVGDFQTESEASSCLREFRSKLGKDAFVLAKEKASSLKPKAKMQQMMVLAQAKLLKTAKTPAFISDDTPKAEEKEVDAVDISGAQEKIIINKKETKTVMVMKDEGKAEEIFSEETSQSLFCKPTKKALREAEISEALSFYKNSSYYRFNQGR